MQSNLFELFNQSGISSGSAASSVIDTTYADLKALADTESLVAYQRYKITDFQLIEAVSFDEGGSSFNYGEIEPIVVMATSPSTLDPQAFSPAFPADIIRYDINNPWYAEGVYVSKGVITYREETTRNIKAYFDWRNGKTRLYEDAPSSGIYAFVYPKEEGCGYQDFPMLAKENGSYSNIDIGCGSTSGITERVVFHCNAIKVTLGNQPDPTVFLGGGWDSGILGEGNYIVGDSGASDIVVGTCSGFTSYCTMQSAVIGSSSIGNVFLGDVREGTEIGSNIGGKTFTGHLVNCKVYPGSDWGLDSDEEPVKILEGDHTGELIGYPVSTSPVINISYVALKALADAGQLVPEQQYRINDFQTKHGIQAAATPEDHTGPVEPILVQAKTTSLLYPHAYSETFPTDILRYDLNYHPLGMTDNKGWITYREDPTRNIISYHDWRNCIVRLYETAPDSGLWDTGPSASGTGEVYEGAYQDVHMLPFDGMGDEYTMHVLIGSLIGNPSGVPQVVFLNGVRKITVGPATDALIFNGSVQDVTVGSCSSITAYGEVTTTKFLGSGGLVLHGNVDSTTFLSSVWAIFEGTLTRCLVYPSVTGSVAGDHADESIGCPGYGINTTFTTTDGKTVTVVNGNIISIV